MSHAFICDFVRTPIGRYGGALILQSALVFGGVVKAIIKAWLAHSMQLRSSSFAEP